MLALRYARSPWARTVGLLGCNSFPGRTALVFERCSSVHTWFMRIPLDIAFVDERWSVLAVYENVRPWRIVAHPKAYAVLELAAGAAKEAGIAPGVTIRA